MLFSETAKLLLPSLELTGTLTITKHFSIFSADEDESKGAVPEDGNFKFYSPDVSAVFTRRFSLPFSPGSPLFTPPLSLSFSLYLRPLSSPGSLSRPLTLYQYIKTLFLTRYMHSYRAVEVFTIGHKSWFLVLSDYSAVKRAVVALPRVSLFLSLSLSLSLY